MTIRHLPGLVGGTIHHSQPSGDSQPTLTQNGLHEETQTPDMDSKQTVKISVYTRTSSRSSTMRRLAEGTHITEVHNTFPTKPDMQAQSFSDKTNNRRADVHEQWTPIINEQNNATPNKVLE